jgi:cytochrome c
MLFLRCASCHDISDTASPKIGPNLKGVVGRKAGSLPGYKYSPAMSSQTFVWDEATLDQWLTKPSDLVPGTAMAFGGVPNKADRDAIIGYLRDPTN